MPLSKAVQFDSHYPRDKMDTLYRTDQSILFLSGDQAVTCEPRIEMTQGSASRRGVGAPPLLAEHRVLHVEQQADHALRRTSP